MKTLQQPQIISKPDELYLIKEEDIKKYLYKMPRHSLEIVFFGSDWWSIHVLKTLEDNFDVKAVVCASGSPVANYFKGLILTPDKLDNNFLTSHFSLLTSDLFLVASYGKIIPQKLLDIPKYGALNVHPSLLPKYRGPSPIQAAILNGDKVGGITIFKMDASMDHGPIIYQEQMELSNSDNFDTLSKKIFQRAADILPQIIKDFTSGKIIPRQQNHTDATYCERLTRKSGYFDIDNPPSSGKLDRMIRAYHPWPGVWTKWSPSAKASGDKQAKIVKFLPGRMLQMEGKRPITYKDFLNGYPDFPLKIF